MIRAVSSSHFISPAPAKNLHQISPFPFILELIPVDSCLEYDLQRLNECGISLYANLLWYRIPSTGAVVFFRWAEVAGEAVHEQEEFSTFEPIYAVPEDHFEFEVDLNGTSQPVDIDEYDELSNKMFAIIPCTYEESEAFYHELITLEGREQLLEEFLEGIGGYSDDEDLDAEVSAGLTGDEADEEESTGEGDPDGWPSFECAIPSSDEEDDETQDIPRTPTRRQKASLVEYKGYDSSDSDGVAWCKVSVDGRLRNRSSLGDLTPTARRTTLP